MKLFLKCKLVSITVGDESFVKTADILIDRSYQGRYIIPGSGDEFAILLPNTNQQETHRVIDRIFEVITKTKEEQLSILLTIGSAPKTTNKQDITEILIPADQAMYKNKSSQKK